MNWGTKILIVYIVFIAGVLYMVFKSSSQKADLVTEDYYARELRYQEKIDEMNRVVDLRAPVEYEIRDRIIFIRFPGDFAGKKLVGEAVLYCPSDENKDIKKNFSLKDETLELNIPATGSGSYELQLSWKDEAGLTYYFEKKIFI